MLQNRYRRHLRGISEASRRQLGGNSEAHPPFHSFYFVHYAGCYPLRPLVRDCILRLTLFIVRDFIPYISACRLLGHLYTLNFNMSCLVLIFSFASFLLFVLLRLRSHELPFPTTKVLLLFGLCVPQFWNGLRMGGFHELNG